MTEREARRERHSRIALWALLVLSLIAACSAVYGAFVVSPNERQEIKETADKAETVADALAKSNAGVTALICTGSNRHDANDLAITKAILPGTRIFDRQEGTNLTDPLRASLKNVPPPTNCGELICQFFREIGEPGATITIDDPYGPDRPEKPCGPATEETTAG